MMKIRLFELRVAQEEEKAVEDRNDCGKKKKIGDDLDIN